MAHVLIEADTLADWMAGDDAPVVLDARTRLADPNAGTALWHEAHIPGAQRADLDQDLSAPPTREGGRHPLPTQSDFTQRLQHWGITPQQRVVIYDDMGGCLSAARAWWMLTWAGHPDIHVLNGGWQAWQAQGYKTESTAPAKPEISNWHPEFDDSLIAPVEDVARGDCLLMDARAGQRYRGETEPMDARAGHIPGALNIPGTSLLDDRQRFVDHEQLAHLLPDSGRGIAYCGSGVSACQLILAYAELDRPRPRLYPGSWSAWSSDPSRPAATGPNP